MNVQAASTRMAGRPRIWHVLCNQTFQGPREQLSVLRCTRPSLPMRRHGSARLTGTVMRVRLYDYSQIALVANHAHCAEGLALQCFLLLSHS